jgi:hypothetical protein
LGVPTNELFDARFYYLTQNVGLSYQATARTQYSANVSGFFTKRTKGLPGVQGGQVGAAIEHQFSQRQSLGAQYQFFRMEFKHAFTTSNGHGTFVTFSRRMSRALSVTGAGGLMMIRVVGARAIQLSPEVAAILGRTVDVAAYRDTLYTPSFEVTAAYSLDDSRFSAGFQHGVGAGNGVFLATKNTSVGAGYAYSGLRNISLAASASYSNMTGLVRDFGQYWRAQAGGSINYRLRGGVALGSTFEVRQFQTGVVPTRSGWFASVGLSYSPAQFPIPVW